MDMETLGYFKGQGGFEMILVFLGILAAEAFLAARLAQGGSFSQAVLGRVPAWAKNERLVSLALIAAFIVVANILSVLQYRSFSYENPADIANHGQALWNTLHGRFFFFTLQPPTCHLAHHFTWVGVLLLPFFALFPSVLTLFAIQISLAALGAWALQITSEKVVAVRGAGPALVLSYLLYPPLYQTILFHFDYEILAISGLMFTLCFFFTQNRAGFLAAALFTLLCREEEGALLLLLGVYGLILKKRPFFSLLPLALGAAGLATAFAVTLSMAGPGPDFFSIHGNRIPGLEGGLLSMAGRQVLHPMETLHRIWDARNAVNLLILAFPLGFLGAALSPLLVLVPLPVIARNLLAFCPFKYYAEAIPFVLFGLALGMRRLSARPPAWMSRFVSRQNASLFFVLFVFLSNFNVHHLIVDGLIATPSLYADANSGERFFSAQRWVPDASDARRREVMARIPDDAPVAAEHAFLPALIQRKYLYRIESAALHLKLARPAEWKGYALVFPDAWRAGGPFQRFAAVSEKAGFSSTLSKGYRIYRYDGRPAPEKR